MPPDPTEPLPLIPPAMVDDLRALSATPPVPSHVDRLVLMNAERQFAQAAHRRRNRFRIQRLAAAAAAVAIFTLAGTLVSRRTAVKPVPRLAADFDGNGVVNILDARALARQIDLSKPPEGGGWDLNADGKVDRADADAIAMRAVRLGGAG